MRFLLALLAVSAFAAGPGAREIVRKSALLSDENDKRARTYTFVERNEERQLDSSGRAKKTEIETFDVTLLEGTSYRRLTHRDDKPLPPAGALKEEEKLRKSIEERRKESPAARQKRIAEYEKRRARFREVTREVADAFNWTIEREETVAGRRAWVLSGMPRTDYKARSREGKILQHLRGKLWIDQADYHWVRAEAEAIDTISIGWFLLRLAPGARVEIDMTRVNDDVWLPKRIAAKASGRLAGFKKLNVSTETTYSNFRKFSTDSRVVSVSEPK